MSAGRLGRSPSARRLDGGGVGFLGVMLNTANQPFSDRGKNSPIRP